MPTALIGPAIGLAGSALGGLAGSKDKVSTQNIDQTQTENTNQTKTAIEPEYFSQFRQSLLPMFAQQASKINQPIYGNREKAGVLSGLNDLASDSIASLKTNLAGRGALDSGALDQGASDIGQARFGKYADFLSQLPMQEANAQRQGMGNLLGLGMNFAGRAPISENITGNTTSTTKGTNTTTQKAPGFLSSFAGGLAGMAGNMFGDWSSQHDWGK